MDAKLDMTSHRPVENQAVARAVVQLQAELDETQTEYAEKSADTNARVSGVAADVAVERARIDNFVAGATAGDEELTDIRVGADGVTYASAGTAVREQFLAQNKRSKDMTYCVEELHLNGRYEPELVFENKLINSENGKLSDSEVRAITNFIYCPYGAEIDVKCNDGFDVFNVGNYDECGVFLGNATDYEGMIFKRFVIGKNDGAAITPTEAVNNVKIVITISPRYMTEAKAEEMLRSYAGVSVGKNLLNRNKSEFGHFLNAQGVIVSYETLNYYTSEFIPVPAGQSVTISPRLRKFLAYDAGFNVNEESYVDAETANYTFTAEKDCYIRFTYYNSDENVQVEYGTEATQYEPFAQTLDPEVVIPTTAVVSALTLKSGMSFGDSIMYGAGNGGDGILDILSETYHIAVHDYSVSGASAEKIEGRSFIGDQIDKAIADGVAPDFILLDGLSNDIVHGELGVVGNGFDYAENGYATFAAGLEYCIGKIKDAFPLTPLLYVIPHSSAGRDYNDELTFGNMAREICQKWSVPVADIYREGNMTARLVGQMQAFTNYPSETTGTHPNKAGYEHSYIPIIAEMLNKILKP